MTRQIRPRVRFNFALCLLMTFLVGCGTELYNQRVAASKELFEYINKLNENLGQAWVQSGVEIRLPKQLVEIPPPKFERNEEGQLVQVGEDLRQPNYMSEELPGLIGAWQGMVEADVAGEFKQVPAYAYIMSNGIYWAKNEPEAAMEFSNSVAETVVNGLNLPPYDPTDWVQKQYPPSPGLVPQQSASVWVTKTRTKPPWLKPPFSAPMAKSSSPSSLMSVKREPHAQRPIVTAAVSLTSVNWPPSF